MSRTTVEPLVSENLKFVGTRLLEMAERFGQNFVSLPYGNFRDLPHSPSKPM